MYITGLVIPVAADRMDTYRKWAANGAAFFKEYGCLAFRALSLIVPTAPLVPPQCRGIG